MNRRFLVFSVATCAFSWACWLPIVSSLGSSPFESPAPTLLLFMLGAYGPTLMGIALTYFYEGRAGTKELFKRALSARAGARWLGVALLVGPIVYAAAVTIYAALGGPLGAVNYGLLPWLPVVFVVPIVFGPLAEEFGWRGFALPLLDHEHRVIASSVLLGFVWALWHAPLFWAQTGTAISGHPVDAMLIAWFFLAVIGSSFLYTWLFNMTAGSLLAAILLHLSMNASGTIVGMLFPDMSLDHTLDLYKTYVAAVWALVLFGAAIQHGYRAKSGSHVRIRELG